MLLFIYLFIYLYLSSLVLSIPFLLLLLLEILCVSNSVFLSDLLLFGINAIARVCRWECSVRALAGAFAPGEASRRGSKVPFFLVKVPPWLLSPLSLAVVVELGFWSTVACFSLPILTFPLLRLRRLPRSGSTMAASRPAWSLTGLMTNSGCWFCCVWSESFNLWSLWQCWSNLFCLGCFALFTDLISWHWIFVLVLERERMHGWIKIWWFCSGKDNVDRKSMWLPS